MHEIGAEGAGVLWYLATYLWLVLLSPLLLRLYRRQRLLTILLPLAVLAVLHTGALTTGGAAVHTAGHVLTFLPCWVLGFAHRDRDLHRLRPALVLALAGGTIGVSLGWLLLHRATGGLDLVPFPLAQAVYSTGFVLLLLRWTPSMAWLAKAPLLQTFVTAVNNRAVTIYLWHNVIITVAIVVGDRFDLWSLHPSAFVYPAFSVLALAMLAATVLALGWVEDVAARRPARLRPWVTKRATPAPVAARHHRPAHRPAPWAEHPAGNLPDRPARGSRRSASPARHRYPAGRTASARTHP